MENVPPEPAAAPEQEPLPSQLFNGKLPPGLVPDEPVEDEPLARQRRSIAKRIEVPSSPSESLGSVIVFLSTLYSQLKDDEKRGPASSPAPEAGRKVLQEKRLSRSRLPSDSVLSRAGLLGEPVAPSAPPEPGILPDSGWMGGPEGLAGFASRPPAPPAPPAHPEPTAGWTSDRPSSRLGKRLLPFVLGLAVVELALAGYLGWRAHAPTAGRAPAAAARGAGAAPADLPPDEVVSEDALAVANAALDATDKGDLPRAFDLLADAQRRRVALPGLSYQAALLAHNLGSQEKLEEWTDRSLAAHELVPECWYLRANDAAARGDFQSALASLETAAHFAPFSPRYEFFWGEYLRRVGTPSLALPHFQQALRCHPSSADTDLILFKQRLARIEVGNDKSFQAELAAQLDREDVPGETWLLAAANELSRAAFPAAVEDLRRAARLLPPGLLRSRLRDYVFQAQARQPDLAAFWSSLTPAPAGSPAGTPPPASPVGTPPATPSPAPKPVRLLVDPATRGLADADPACW